MAEPTIDGLLARYLHLLDQYTTLQTQLTTLHRSLHQNLAKANFAAERGIRYYGKDYYDGRMQALRRVAIAPSSQASSAPESVQYTISSPEATKKDDGSKEEAGSIEDEGNANNTSTEKEDAEDDTQESQKQQQKRQISKDPLRWFGLLTPLPLRQAQQVAIQSVEEIIPRLATVNAEMAMVEVQVRRARKRRAKAEKEKEKESERVVGGGEGEISAEV